MKSQNEPEIHEVDIKCEDGVFTYTKDNFEVDEVDSIEWSCEGSKDDIFGVILEKEMPFDWKTKNKKRTQKIKGKIKTEPDYGACKYYVIVTEGENIWIDDPIFIIRRP